MDGRRIGWALGLALFCWTAGCKHPVQIVTNNRVTMNTPTARAQSPLAVIPVTPGAPGVERRIALVDVDGLLLNQPMTGLYSEGENPVALFREKLDRIARSGCYAAVVLRINSPGGGVTASDVMCHDLQEFKARTHLPVVACLMDVGAGGAYYLATAADQIVAHPTTVTGGIGVILNLYNLEDAMAQFNVLGAPIKAGENVDLGTPIKAQSEEAREILQRMANSFHERFRRIVIERRPQLAQAPADVFDGRIFTADHAVSLGLVDTIGYLDQAAEIAGQMGGAPGASLVLLHRPNDGARTPYDVTANVPLQSGFLPLSMPGLERARLPTFLYMWQPEPTLERLGGR
ncbi:MAG TPA: S49 family peptidase [Pirellulales bacterium]|jgi:protease-4